MQNCLVPAKEGMQIADCQKVELCTNNASNPHYNIKMTKFSFIQHSDHYFGVPKEILTTSQEFSVF